MGGGMDGVMPVDMNRNRHDADSEEEQEEAAGEESSDPPQEEGRTHSAAAAAAPLVIATNPSIAATESAQKMGLLF